MNRPSLLSLFRRLSRHLCTQSETSAYQRTPGPKPRTWPLDHRGEEIRTAKARRLGISTSDRKLNMVAKLVRGLSIREAERQLVGCRKKHAEDVRRTILAAVTNARYFGFREDRLIVNEAYVGKGKYLKKIRPWHGKGRYGIEHKKYAHLTVVLRELDEELWEAKVLPQYVHMRYRMDEKILADENHPVRTSDKVGYESQLDLSFKMTKEKIEGLKQLLGREDAGSAGVKQTSTK